jgi:hypothetical protein
MDNAVKGKNHDLDLAATLNRPRLWNVFVLTILGVIGAGIGMSVVRMSSTTAIIAAAGVVLIWLLVKQIEIPFYFAVFSVIALQEVEITQGSLLTLFENYKAPGVPSILEISIVLLSICFLVKYFIQREHICISIFRVPIVIFFALFLVALVDGISSGNNDILIKEDSKKFMFPFLFFLCSVNILDTPQKVKRLFVFISLLTLIKIYLGIVSYLRGFGFEYGNSGVVFVETADLILVVTVLVAMVSMMIYQKITWKMASFVLIVGAPLVFSLVYSNRRNAWLGILLALALLFFLTPVKLKPRMATILLCSGLAGVSMISISVAMHGLPSGQDLKQRFSSISDKSDKSNEAHVNEWIVTVEALQEHPFLGLGFGSEHAPVPGDDTINRHTVHNAFLMLYMKMGVFAVILFIWALIHYFRFVVCQDVEKCDSLSPLRVGLFSTFAYWLVTLNVAPSWWYYRETCMMALVAAIVIRLSLVRADKSVDANSDNRLVIGNTANEISQ